MLRSALLYVLIPSIACIPAIAQENKTRDQMVREDRGKVTTEGFWIYNDLAHAFDVAKESSKPLLVVLRCIPCEECVKLDDELVDRDPVLRPLLEKFVCVRIVSTNGEAIPAAVLNPYPHPKSLGLLLDPNHSATVKVVQPDTIAAKAGFQPGDAILKLQGQPLLSMADLQWVLHSTPAEAGELKAVVDRDGTQIELTVNLPAGWRELDDISWRVSAWGLRRMVTGGLVLEPVADDERGQGGVPVEGMALRVKHVGQYGAHAAAKNAGFQKDDIVVMYDGHNDLLTDSDVLRYGVTQHVPGDNVAVEVVRSGKRLMLQLPMQP